jgi:hypothetical protein
MNAKTTNQIKNQLGVYLFLVLAESTSAQFALGRTDVRFGPVG